jgi:regulator of Ty1 transposition protein 103
MVSRMRSLFEVTILMFCTEVVQQSKARHRDDFPRTFSPIIPEATEAAYKGASSDIQAKIRRVADVWKERNIFEPNVRDELERRLQGQNCLPLW